MFQRMMFEDLPSAISLPASAAGAQPSGSPAGKTKGRSGPARARASRSLPPASEKEPQTSGTCGPSSDASLRSADLQRHLASKLEARMAAFGSPEFSLALSSWDMPSREPIFRLRASARRTSDNAFGGWPMPNTGHEESLESWRNRKETEYEKYPGKGLGAGSLATIAQLAGWPTTRSTDGNNGQRSPDGAIAEFERKGTGADLPTVANLAGWVSPRASEIGRQRTPEAIAKAKEKGGSAALEDQARLASWATPANRDYRYPNNRSYQDRSNSTKGEQLNNQVVHHGPISPSSPASTANRGVLNPAHSRWLMGYRAAWDEAAPSWSEWQSVQRELTGQADSKGTETQLFQK